MTRTRDEAQVSEAKRLYGLGLTTYAIAAQVHADPRTVQRWCKDIIRPRGPRPAIDPDAVRRARKGRKEPWDQVAVDLGASRTAVRKAYQRTYGDNGHVDHHNPLTGKQRAELRALWDSVPPPATGGDGHSMDTSEGRRVRSLLQHYRRAGMTTGELGGAIGVSGSRVRAITRDG